jgi:hypothetical protein
MDMFVHDEVVATLSELGLPTQSKCIQTMLIRDGRFVGHKFLYEHGCAVLQPDGSTLELYDVQGTLLNTVPIGTGSKKRVAA